MSFHLDALFREPVELYPEPPSPKTLSKGALGTKAAAALLKENSYIDGMAAEDGEDAGTTVLGDTLTALILDRNAWKAQAEERNKIINGLDQRISRDPNHSDLPGDVVRRFNRHESEVTRLKSENAQLKDSLYIIECENTRIGNQNDGKARKLKGANKKVKNAKDVAGKQEEKAKEAVGDKQRHLASERNDALAALQEQKKINMDLVAKLEVEQSGAPHVREAAGDPNNTLVVIPIEFEIRRIDIQALMMSFEVNQMSIAQKFKIWYEGWKEPKEEVRNVVGANYLDDEKKKNARIYEDMVEMPDGYMETGAEHDGQRSKRSLESVCRHAEARYNGDG
jgi:hypothetical protein